MIDFDALGASLERAWTQADRDEERFVDLAAAHLEGLADRFDAEAFFDLMLDPSRPARQQLAPAGAFGQPGFTVFHGDGFVLEAYVWIDALCAIHNHPFCGAFTVLHGHSLHARYRVSAATRAGSRGQLLDVRLRDLQRVHAGEVHRFSLRRHPLVHALVHIPIPTVSMVARTVRTEGYYRYLPPSLALPMEPLGEPAARRLALLESLVRMEHPSALERVCDALRVGDFETTVHLLSITWLGATAENRVRLRDAASVLHGDRTEAIEAALQRARRLEEASAIRSGLRDPAHRLCATALAYAESRSHVETALAGVLGDPASALHDFIDNAGLFAPDEAPSAAIAHALVDGQDDDTLLGTLAEAFGTDAMRSQREEILRYATESIFSVLRPPAEPW